MASETGGPNGRPEKGKYPRILDSVSWNSDPETHKVTMTFRGKADKITHDDIKELVDEIYLDGVTWVEIKIPSIKSDIVRCTCGGRR